MDPLEDVWRREAPHVLGALVRRYGDFDGCEDAVAEALSAATVAWPRDGLPHSPRGWLIRVASRRLIDAWRSEQARVDREHLVAARLPREHATVSGADEELAATGDDTLQLLLLCCHSALSPAAQVALTLRAVGGLSTAQIAAAFMVPSATMGQRISRAKSVLRSAGARFESPSPEELADRVDAVLQVLYLIFNEGYATSGGAQLVDVSLTREAVRLARQLAAVLPESTAAGGHSAAHDEAVGLLALMLLTDARAASRVDSQGDLVPLADQDRSRWDREQILEGRSLLERVLPRGPVGRFQLEAAIAGAHGEATTWAQTDWLQITMLYRMLDRLAPGPMVSLNLAVAVGMAHGAEAGLALVDALAHDPALRDHHRRYAVRAHLLEMTGRTSEAAGDYAIAARLTTSQPEQRYLNACAGRLSQRTGARRASRVGEGGEGVASR